MSVPVIAFFNNKGGVGKTSLAYHLAWMLADLGQRVLAVDLDPQANLSAAFLDDDRLEELWPETRDRGTVFGAIQPLLRGIGDVTDTHLEEIDSGLALLVGDLLLSGLEGEFSVQWDASERDDERALHVTSAFWRIVHKAARAHRAELVLVDLAPNLGAINRAALIACDCLVVPVLPDLFSVHGLRNVGTPLRRWRREWKQRLDRNPRPDFDLPTGEMRPLGYVVLQQPVRLDRPLAAHGEWMARIPGAYRSGVLNDNSRGPKSVAEDPHCLAVLSHYQSLMSMAQQARKPMFHLAAADGAIGSHLEAAQRCRTDFHVLASKISLRATAPPARSPDPLP